MNAKPAKGELLTKGAKAHTSNHNKDNSKGARAATIRAKEGNIREGATRVAGCI